MPRSSPAPLSRAPAAKETTIIVIRKRRVDPAEEGPRRAGLPAWRRRRTAGRPPQLRGLRPRAPPGGPGRGGPPPPGGPPAAVPARGRPPSRARNRRPPPPLSK